MTTSPCPFVAGLAGSAADGSGGGLGGLVGDLALADPVLGLAVGEDLAEVAADRLGAHPGLVAVAQPLLGLRARATSRSLLPWRRIACTCRACGPIGSTTASSDGVQVGADPGGDRGALARVGVERLQPGERAGVHLAEVLVDGLDVGAALLDREGTISRQAR